MQGIAKSEVVAIIITFVVGFLCGSYLYLNHFPDLVRTDVVDDIEDIERFSIVGEAYGGCRSNCPSFQVKSDGTYRYKYTPEIGKDPKFVSGKIPRKIQKAISSTVSENELIRQSRQINPANCPSFNDGIDIRYIVTVSGVKYKLDSCGTNVDFNSGTWQSLSAIWRHFESVH